MNSPNTLHILSDDAPETAGRDAFARRVLETFFDASGNPHTRDAKTRDLADFAEFFAADDLTPDVLHRIIDLEASGILQTATAYKAWLRNLGRSPATINRRLASLRGLLRVASQLGAPCPDPRGLVPLEKGGESYRDTEGPEIAEVAKMLEAINRKSEKGKRDYALLFLFTTNAIRKNEALSANVEDFNPKRNRLRIRRKGQGGQTTTLSLDEDATAAIQDYLDARGDTLRPDSPLFASCNFSSVNKGSGRRLSGRGWEKVLAEIGKRVLGEKLHPHSLRHTATTAALDATGGDITRVQALTGHKKPETLLIYFHRKRDDQGEMTRLLAGLLRAERDREAG